MKFTSKVSPNYRDTQSTTSIMLTLTVGLCCVYAFSLYYYFSNYSSSIAMRAVVIMVVAVLSSVMTEVLWALVTKKSVVSYITKSYPWITGMILTLIVPINTSYYALAVTTVLSLVFGKLLFGGFGQNIFNPAGIGRAIIFSAFTTAVVADITTGATPTQTMNGLGWIIQDASSLDAFIAQFGGFQNLFIGLYPGALGETCTLVILLVGVVLAIRKVIDWRVPTVYLGTLFVLASIAGFMNGAGLWYPLFHLLTGGAVFGAVFMLTDPVTNPTSTTGRIIFAMGAAIITFVIRIFGNLPEGVVFSILIMNLLTPLIEKITDGEQVRMLKKYRSLTLLVASCGILISLFAGFSLKPVAINHEEDPIEDLPEVSLGTPIAVNDEVLNRYQGEILSETSEGNLTTYHVAVNGYGLVDDDGSHGLDYSQNEYEIVVDTESMTLVSITYLHFGDTKGFGDKTMNEGYYATFVGMSMNDNEQEVDVVSGATMTSRSMISAIRIVMDALGE